MSDTTYKKKLTPTRRANLERLAAYLEYLPEDYAHFEMSDYLSRDWGEVPEGDYHTSLDLEAAYAKDPKVVYRCGTVACALGHAPASGFKLTARHINPLRPVGREGSYKGGDINWIEVTRSFLGEDQTQLEDFLFGGGWSEVDNTVWGAAARIRFILAGKPIPSDYDEYDRQWVEKYAPYKVTERGPLPADAAPLLEKADG